MNGSKMRRRLLAVAGMIVLLTGGASAQIVALGHSAVRPACRLIAEFADHGGSV
jgi:hypothetical protein